MREVRVISDAEAINRSTDRVAYGLVIAAVVATVGLIRWIVIPLLTRVVFPALAWMAHWVATVGLPAVGRGVQWLARVAVPAAARMTAQFVRFVMQRVQGLRLALASRQ